MILQQSKKVIKYCALKQLPHLIGWLGQCVINIQLNLERQFCQYGLRATGRPSCIIFTLIYSCHAFCSHLASYSHVSGVKIINNLLFNCCNTYTSSQLSFFSFTTLKGKLNPKYYRLYYSIVKYWSTGG